MEELRLGTGFKIHLQGEDLMCSIERCHFVPGLEQAQQAVTPYLCGPVQCHLYLNESFAQFLYAQLTHDDACPEITSNHQHQIMTI